MRESWSDLFRKKNEREVESRRLRGSLWLTHAIESAGLSPEEFAARVVERYVQEEGEARGGPSLQPQRTRSRLFHKWLKLLATPTPLSAQAVEKVVPHTLWVFELPLAELLRDRPLSVRRIRALSRPYRKSHAWAAYWDFPNDQELIDRRHYRIAFTFSDHTEALVDRGDLWGFIGILFEVRMAEALGAHEAHLRACRDMFRALPNVLKISWIAPHGKALYDACQRIRARSMYSFLMFDVDLEIIRRQTQDPDHEPMREFRKRDPRTFRFVDIEDPILPALIIRGVEFRDQQRKRLERNARDRERRKRK